jgi:uncharacterized membrane protein
MRRKGNVGVTENTDTEKQRVMWGWITAVFVPLVGIILGIVNMVKGTLGHGIGQIIASLFFWSFWAGFWAAFFG